MVVGKLLIEGFGFGDGLAESSRSRMQQTHHIVFQQGDHKYLQWVLPVQQRLSGGRSLLGNKVPGGRNTGGVITSTTRSLDLIRQIIQKHINRDLHSIIHSYLEKYIKPGMENIRDNKGEGSVTEEHVNYICRQILEEAKTMYPAPQSYSGSPFHDHSDPDAPYEGKRRRSSSSSPRRKRKESDTDSECSQPAGRKRPRIPSASTPLRPRDVIRWDPNNITTSTKFIMGSRANKALGFGQTRGRLYIRHPELYKYSGDQVDKEWLARQHLLPGAGGKAYLLILDEVKKLAETDDYRTNPGVITSELVGFSVPGFMIEKVRSHMQQVKNEALAGTQQNNVTLESTSLLQELVSGRTDRKPSLGVSDSDGIDSPLLPLDDIGSSHGTPTSELNAVLESSFDFASSPKV